MTPDESRRSDAALWFAHADKDLNAAALLAAPEPSRSVFHSQQAAEKAAKALLVYHGVPFRRTHDIEELGVQCASVCPEIESLMREASTLTAYAVTFRYPDSPSEPDEDEAHSALGLARRVCAVLRRQVD